MCIILIAWKAHPQYPLVIAANRDEFHDRPALPLHNWEGPGSIAAGRDLSAGGTWLGISGDGLFAGITNYRDFRLPLKPDAPSRGELIPMFFQTGPESFSKWMEENGPRYNPFSLLFGDSGHLFFYSNQGDKVQEVASGFHGLSNHLLNTPWPKVTRGKAALEAALNQPPAAETAMLGALQDTATGDDELLPDTGRDLDFERRVSPVFILDPVYGTRCSSVIVARNTGEVLFTEHSWRANGSSAGQTSLRRNWAFPA